MWHYLKFSLFHVLTLVAIVSVLLGNIWIPIGYLIITATVVVGDALLGDDLSTPEYQHVSLLTWQLWLALPLIFCLFVVSLWSVSSTDTWQIGQVLQSIFGYDFNQAKADAQIWHYVIGVMFIGLMYSTVGTVTGHELIHRTWDKTSLQIGRWLLAFSFDSNFSIEHVYGHHRYVATPKDPASAPRGRNVYQHIVLSTIKGNISAWSIESARLTRRNQAVFSWHNTCLRGYAMSLTLLLLAYVIAGWMGLVFFTLCGLWAKAMLEIVNYMEHYGIVRDPKTRVAPRHSWNTNRKISCWALFNLSRHSHHHAKANVPYHQLEPMTDSPTMLSGYLATMGLTLIPPLWFKLMEPKLKQWDQHFANDRERELIQQLS